MIKTEQRNSFRITNERMKSLLKDRLTILGGIRADDAWQICRSSGFSYGVILLHFKCIMNAMKDDGRADQICNGTWFITAKRTVIAQEKKLTLEELSYIFENRLQFTSAEIAADLGVSEHKVIMTCIQNRWKYILKSDELKVTRRAKRTCFFREEDPEPDTQKKFTRPPAVYNNPRSPYGIADELHNR